MRIIGLVHRAEFARSGILGDKGALVLTDACIPTSEGRAGYGYLPSGIAYYPDLPLDARFAHVPSRKLDRRELPSALDELTAPHRIGRLLVLPNGFEFSLFLFGVAKDSPPPLMAIIQTGDELTFQHRERSVSLALSAHAGHFGHVICRWEPDDISIEYIRQTSAGIILRARNQQQPIYRIETIFEGGLHPPQQIHGQTWRAKLALGIVLFIDEGSSQSDIDDITRRLTQECSSLAIASLPRPSAQTDDALLFPVHATTVKVPSETFNSWRKALGRGASWFYEYELFALQHPISAHARDRAIAVGTASIRLQIERACGISSTLTRNTIAEFLHVAAANYFYTDVDSLAFISNIKNAIGRKKLHTDRVLLESSELQIIFETADRAWLTSNATSTRPPTSAPPQETIIRESFGPQYEDNLVLQAWRLLRDDVVVPVTPEHSYSVELWNAARTLAAELETLTNKDVPASEMRRRLQRRGEQSGQDLFELTALAWLLRTGITAAFVPTVEGLRTPDIRADVSSRDVFVECWARRQESERDEKMRKGAIELLRVISAQANRRKFSLLIEADLADWRNTQARSESLAELKSRITTGQFPCQASGVGWSIGVRQIGAWNQIWSMQTIQQLAPAAQRVYAIGNQDDLLARNGYSKNVCVLGVTSNHPEDLLPAIAHALSDKGRAVSQGGQLPDDKPGVIAMSLGDLSQDSVTEVINALPHLLHQRRHVSAAALFWSQRQTSDFVTFTQAWHARIVVNTKADFPLPEAFPLEALTLATGFLHPVESQTKTHNALEAAPRSNE